MTTVCAVTLLIWGGLFAYLWHVSRQVDALARKLDSIS